MIDWCGAGNPPAPGDFDGDGDVDMDDYISWDNCATGPVITQLAEGCAVFDFDQDSDIDLLDFQSFSRYFLP
jgi:hypothetical protein